MAGLRPFRPVLASVNAGGSHGWSGVAVSRRMYQLSGAEAALGFALLLFAPHWYAAFLGWGAAAVTYLAAGSAQRLERGE